MQIDAIDPELTLKATPPRTARTFIAREHLSLGVLPMRTATVLAVHAPAGFGKTSLLNQWRREALRRGAIGVWLCLDEHDTPDRFVRGLRLALLLGCGADAPADAIERMRMPIESPLDGATTWLADVASLAREVVLLLDDAHLLVSRLSHDLLGYIVLNAPANLKLVLGSRDSLPPAVLDVAPFGQLATVTTDNLRLTESETERLLRLQVGQRFDATASARLHALTGGWPLGLQLLVSTIRDSRDVGDAIAALHPCSRNVTLYFGEYLDGRLAPDAADFLLRICISDVVNASLARALTERADAGVLLKELSISTPIFAQVMTDDWLRMHSLALDFLRERALATFDERQISELHLAAAAWFTAEGMPEPAARHSLAGGRSAAAFDLAEDCMPEILAHGDLSRVLDWFDRIPLDEAKTRPGVASTAAWALAVFAERRTEALPLIDAVLANPDAPIDAKASAAAALLYYVSSQDDVERERDIVEGCVDMRLVGHKVLDEMLAFVSGISALYSGQPALARFACRHVIDREGRVGFFVSETCLSVVTAYSHYWEGRVDIAEELLRPQVAAALTRFGRRSASSTCWEVTLAAVLWERDQVEEVTALLHERLGQLEHVQDFRLTVFGYTTAAKLAFHHGNESKALQLLEHLGTLGELRQLPRLAWESLAEQIRIHAHCGRAKTCATLLERFEAMASQASVRLRGYSAELFAMTLCIARAYTAIAGQKFRVALVALDEGETLATHLQRGREDVVVKLLTALVKRRVGEESDNLLAEALSLARSCGLRRVVRDAHPELVPIVEAWMKRLPAGDQAALALADDPEPEEAPFAMNTVAAGLLTPKEHEVLRHLAEAAANRRIATVMEVSEETVKWHMKNLFAKLGGANRKHVVERARQLGVIQ